jgi:hypothetical protein
MYVVQERLLFQKVSPKTTVVYSSTPKMEDVFRAKCLYYRVSIKSFSDDKHLLQENYVE